MLKRFSRYVLALVVVAGIGACYSEPTAPAAEQSVPSFSTSVSGDSVTVSTSDDGGTTSTDTTTACRTGTISSGNRECTAS